MGYSTGLGNLQQVLSALGGNGVQEAGAAAMQKTRNGSSSQAVDTAAANGDKATVSASGGAMAQALAGSDVRGAMVQSLQQAIAAGTYNVPSGAVADKLIEAMLGGS